MLSKNWHYAQSQERYAEILDDRLDREETTTILRAPQSIGGSSFTGWLILANRWLYHRGISRTRHSELWKLYLLNTI